MKPKPAENLVFELYERMNRGLYKGLNRRQGHNPLHTIHTFIQTNYLAYFQWVVVCIVFKRIADSLIPFPRHLPTACPATMWAKLVSYRALK